MKEVTGCNSMDKVRGRRVRGRLRIPRKTEKPLVVSLPGLVRVRVRVRVG